jgi:hypothetical protein
MFIPRPLGIYFSGLGHTSLYTGRYLREGGPRPPLNLCIDWYGMTALLLTNTSITISTRTTQEETRIVEIVIKD